MALERNGADNCISGPMMIWLVLTVMSLAAMAWLLLPFRQEPAVADRSDYDRAVFRDQLSELDRDVARGVIGEAEAEAARNEISRRLLQAIPGASTGSSHAPWIAILGVLMIPVVALPLYLQRGSPKLSDVPLAARLEDAILNQDFDAMIAKVERHLAEQPDDIQGWTVLAPAYKRLQRWDDAATAYANIVRLGPASPETIADYGEMLVFASQGMVTAEAQRAFGEALKLEPKLPKARYFHGLGLKQEGRREEALAAFQSLLADTPPESPLRFTLEAELSADMTEADRAAMIKSMVDGLEAKLAANGGDLEGWQRLIRARGVLGEREKARAALEAARQQFKDKPEAMSALEGSAKEAGIE
ncbi:MAG: c-type cytochrome biogenesis protein CcmI [Rhizobiales bacterium]|nr:c-type cytochrome biogenesis protein CcmI [Hyphomicrobiales bacterium]